MVGGSNKGMSASGLNSDHDHDPPHSIMTASPEPHWRPPRITSSRRRWSLRYHYQFEGQALGTVQAEVYTNKCICGNETEVRLTFAPLCGS